MDLSTTGSALAGMRADLLGAPISAAEIKAMGGAIDNVTSALSTLGTRSYALQTHMTFIDKLQDTLDASVGRLVDADMAKEATKLQALQIKQQLAIKSLSIANSGPATCSSCSAVEAVVSAARPRSGPWPAARPSSS